MNCLKNEIYSYKGLPTFSHKHTVWCTTNCAAKCAVNNQSSVMEVGNVG